MNEKERGHALEVVRIVYGALIASAVYQVIEYLHDTQEAMICASKIAQGGR